MITFPHNGFITDFSDVFSLGKPELASKEQSRRRCLVGSLEARKKDKPTDAVSDCILYC